MTTRKDISVTEDNGEYIIEVYFFDYNKEKVEKKLADIDNNPFKKHLLEFHSAKYTYQFDLSDNHYLDYFQWEEIADYLSEEGKAVITKIIEEGKTYYVPAKIIEKNPNKIKVEYRNGEKKEFTNPDDYQIILNNPEGKPDALSLDLKKWINILVSIEDEISRELIKQYPRLILKGSRIPSEEEIEKFKTDWKNNYIIIPPHGIKSIEDGRPPLRTGELREKFHETENYLSKLISEDIKKNKSIKQEERMKALNEMNKKWGIELILKSHY